MRYGVTVDNTTESLPTQLHSPDGLTIEKCVEFYVCIVTFQPRPLHTKYGVLSLY